MGKKNLSPRQQAFVREYLLSGNATDAYRRAGYKSKNPDVDGPALLGTPGISALINSHQKKLQAKFEWTRDEMAEQLRAIARGSISELADWDEDNFRLKPKKDLTPEALRFIDGIKVKKTSFQGVDTVEINVTTLAREKVRAIEAGARLMGYDRNESKDAGKYQDVLAEAIAELNKAKTK